MGKSVDNIDNYQAIVDEYDREEQKNVNRVIGNKFQGNYRKKFCRFRKC
jgi:curli production assembly/transport component CsgG